MSWIEHNLNTIISYACVHYTMNYRATAEAVAALKNKRDRVAEFHYITRGA